MSRKSGWRPWTLVVLVALLNSPTAPAQTINASHAPQPSEAIEKFRDSRFGLILNWGVYALVGKGEQVMERDRLPISEYDKLPPRFNPTEFDPDAWVGVAKNAGAKYVVVSAKGPDGFCMFDSKLTRYDVVDATPWGKDPLKLLADACKKRGVPLFVSYSLLDWHHPDYAPIGQTGRASGRDGRGEWSKYVAYCQGQVRELCTNYGPIGGVWFEGERDRPDADWGLESMCKMVRELQPGALIASNRRGAPRPNEDVQVFDRDMPGQNSSGRNVAAPDSSKAWEARVPLNNSWGFDLRDRRFKAADDIIRIIAQAAGRDANLLLGVAPRADGSLPPEAVDRLAKVGQWLEPRRETILSTRAGPIKPQPWGVSTVPTGEKRDKAIYLHVLAAEGPVRLPGVILAFEARVLGGSKPLPARQDGKDVLIELPLAERTPGDTVIVLTPGKPATAPGPAR